MPAEETGDLSDVESGWRSVDSKIDDTCNNVAATI